VKRQQLNLTGAAWRQLRRNWSVPFAPALLWQTLVPGSMFAAMDSMQRSISSDGLAKANLTGAVVILGYWRSGTTLLHELLCLDPRYTFPTTHACMNPHHFLLTEQAALARDQPGVRRPMDDMEVRAGSPQEDEFALLSLGARSPYEALLVSEHLPEALKLADPRDLTPAEEIRWHEVFLNFLRGVSMRGAGRPVILKSPTHGFRVTTLRELLPDARFVLIVRDPMINFESVIRMWHTMFETYSTSDRIPADDEIREAVLADRPRFEAKLDAGTAGLPSNRFAVLTYERLIENPSTAVEQLYNQLDLGDFKAVQPVIEAEIQRRRDYRALGKMPSPEWQQRIATAWREVFAKYGYGDRGAAAP
jgi:hypothetical protein